MPASTLAPIPGRAANLPPPRAYGQHRTDLDFDFGQSDRPSLVTAILAQCCASGPGTGVERAESAWNLPLGRRIARLLEIVSLSSDGNRLPLTLLCPETNCGQPFEIGLAVTALTQMAPPELPGAEIIQFPLPNSRQLALRLPTGRDQIAWQRHAYSTAHAATEAVVRSLMQAGSAEISLTPEELVPLATAMEQADPLVAFHVSTQCPNCNRNVDVPVDLELAALRKLSLLRQNFIRQIHALATRYAWNEDNIIAIPPSRRAEYLQLIADEEGTLS